MRLEGIELIQYSYLDNPMNRRVWRATVHRVKSVPFPEDSMDT